MATFFEWDQSKLGLGVRDMDSEHQQLVALMNTLHALHERKAPTADLAKALDAFASYTIKHFADEEAYMAKINFPEARVHAGVHKSLLGRVTDYVNEFKKTGKLSDAFFMFLKTWLKAHICGVDTKYGQFAKQVNAA